MRTHFSGRVGISLALYSVILLAIQGFAAEPETLTLQDAQARSIKNHPRITADELIALASQQVVREVRSAFFPVVTADATAVGTSGDNTRIAAGAMNNPLILERNAEGVQVNQIITDFGRTANLTASAKLSARASEQGALATRAEILLEVNAAYYAALQAQSVYSVAAQTVDTRQLVYDQVSQLASNQLRSGLDVSFAKVNLDEGKLLLASATNDLAAAFARLANLLGEREQRNYRLVEQPITNGPAGDDAQLIQATLHNRPDLQELQLSKESAERFARAENDLDYPTISAVGAAGVLPTHDSQLKANYAAAGVNLSLPIFDGLQFSARQREAALRAKAAAERLRDAENNAIRDMRVAALNADLAHRRMTLTSQLLDSASQAYDLADARYRAGSSSIVELSQAQLNKTEAEIAVARAKYDYLLQNAILGFQTGELR